MQTRHLLTHVTEASYWPSDIQPGVNREEGAGDNAGKHTHALLLGVWFPCMDVCSLDLCALLLLFLLLYLFI